MQGYEEAYKKLNSRQKQAVEQIDGPVLVIAGPGTGKTELLSTRVARILKTTDTRPSEILCLTFTNKAALNMQERVIKMVGSEGARVTTSTFHSFAGEIMAAYPDYFWNAARLSASPETVQLAIIEDIVSKLPLDNPLALKFAGQHTLISDIQKSINLAKDSGLTPEKLKSLLEFNLAYIDVIEETMVELLSERLAVKKLDSLSTGIEILPEQTIDEFIYPLKSLPQAIKDSLQTAVETDIKIGKTTNTSAWKSQWVQTENGQRGMHKERARNRWWLELSKVYELYRQAIHERGYYDYADMLVETISQLESNNDMLADIQERYSYVMIDEFQDTNPAQLRLAHLVADHFSAEGSPNLMAVGDDDQTIFKFNGAELNNMLGFSQQYPKAKIIVLTDNYRSSQEILNLADQVIGQASVRVSRQNPKFLKKLTAKQPPRQKTLIGAMLYDTQQQQLSAVAREIKKTYSSQKTIAVLARSHKSLIKLAGILNQLKVPVRYEQQANILDHEVVRQVYLIAQIIESIDNGDDRGANFLLQQTIRHPAWGIKPHDLWRLALDNGSDSSWLNGLLESKDEHLSTIGKWFLEVAQITHDQPINLSLEQILGLRPVGGFTSPLKTYFTGDSEAIGKYLHGLSAIQLLRSMASEFGAGQPAKLDDLRQLIKLNLSNKKIIADETVFVSGNHAVQLLTVYKAKGLEFDEVYVIDAIDKNWSPKKGGRKPPANLPLLPAGEDLDDYIRLLYVAITRARYKFFISTYNHNEQGEDVAVSSIMQSAFTLKRAGRSDTDELIEVIEQNIVWPDLGHGEEKAMLKERLEGISINPTSLLNFLDVGKGGPLYFKERNLLRLPEAKTPQLAYGTAIHAALQTAQKLVNGPGLNLKKVQSAYSKALSDEQLTNEDLNRYDIKGQKALEKLFGQLGLKLQKGAQAEKQIASVRLDKAIIGGKLDCLITDGRSILISDYKTGRYLSSFYSKSEQQALKAYKHKLQLVFYALLAKNHPQLEQYTSVECQMVYIEADKPSQMILSYKPTDEDIHRLRRLIEAVWIKIQDLNFPDTGRYSPDLSGVLKFEEDLISGL